MARSYAFSLSLPVIGLLAHSISFGADIIVLTNGDQLKGEIKKLEKEVITFSTDYSDEDFKIKWEKVARIDSDRKFLVEKFTGERIEGPVKPDASDAKATTVGGNKLELPEVAYLRPFEQTFWSRIDAGFDVGYSMTKANGVKQFTSAVNVVYTGEKTIVSLMGDAFMNRQSNVPKTSRWEVAPEYRRLFGRAWYANVGADFLSSDEQQLSLRSTLAGGIGRYVLRSPVQHLAIGSGLAFTNERYKDPAIPNQRSGEVYVATEYVTERLKFADLITRFTIYPSMTIPGRYRFNFKFDLDFNLPGDWYIKTGYYNNFDSMPPGGLPRNDYGWKNSFGYEF